MFNEKILKVALAQYKQVFSNRWKDEKYKWEAVKYFQDVWDINAKDFPDMLNRSLSNVSNKLVYPFLIVMIERFAQQEPDTVRAMFLALYDESQNVFERIENFKVSAKKLFDKYPPGNATFSQNENSISAYLWLRYPDKYYVYKNGDILKVAEFLENDYRFKQGTSTDKMRLFYEFYNNICAELKNDKDIINILKDHLTDTCYSDPELRTLTIDFSYFYLISQYNQQQADEWLPKDYDPNLSVEDWRELLDNTQIFDTSCLEIMKRFQDYGGEATCTQISERYGETWQFYSNKIWSLGDRIAKKVNCPIPKSEKGKDQPWFVLFLTRKANKNEAGSDVFKIRDELAKALTQKDLSNIRLYAANANIDNSYTKENFLKEVYMNESKYDTLAAVLSNKKNIILQGAPGVGKTFTAKRLAYSLMGKKDESRVEFVQFHQNYSYEDFMMGYKPVKDGFDLKYGIFYKFCKKAEADPKRDYYFIIDEINRGNMSKIFGELLMLIEREYRDTSIKLAYNGENFSVPSNLYIIGMMNTADRSLAMIDYALRRRFSFFEMSPGFDSEGFIQYQQGLNDNTLNELINQVKNLNKEIAMDRSLGKGFMIGHSYFSGCTECTEKWLQDIVEYDIIPMLREYWFDDTEKLQRWENKLRGVFQ